MEGEYLEVRRKAEVKTGRQQVDTGPNISPNPEEVEDKQTDLFRRTRAQEVWLLARFLEYHSSFIRSHSKDSGK